MTNARNRNRQTGFSEHLIFLALLMPTFLVIAAAAISFVGPDQPSVAVSAVTMAVCGPCQRQSEQGY